MAQLYFQFILGTLKCPAGHKNAIAVKLWANFSPLVREYGFRNPVNFCWRNPESWESGIPIKIGILNPSPTEKDWNPVRGIRNCLGFPYMRRNFLRG